jgi:TonB family protein
LPKPIYPPAARAVKAQGAVNVQVIIDEEGNVESANAVSGHPLLRNASEEAARNAKFTPTLLENIPVKVSGVIVYNFVGEKDWMSYGMEFGLAEINGMRNPIVIAHGFDDEQRQLNQLKVSPIEAQKAQLSNITASIKSKLSAGDLWLFEYGIAKAKVFANLSEGDDNLILSNLAAFKTLAADQTTDVPTYLQKKASKLAEFADKTSLSEDDKILIRYHL